MRLLEGIPAVPRLLVVVGQAGNCTLTSSQLNRGGNNIMSIMETLMGETGSRIFADNRNPRMSQLAFTSRYDGAKC